MFPFTEILSWRSIISPGCTFLGESQSAFQNARAPHAHSCFVASGFPARVFREKVLWRKSLFFLLQSRLHAMDGRLSSEWVELRLVLRRFQLPRILNWFFLAMFRPNNLFFVWMVVTEEKYWTDCPFSSITTALEWTLCISKESILFIWIMTYDSQYLRINPTLHRSSDGSEKGAHPTDWRTDSLAYTSLVFTPSVFTVFRGSSLPVRVSSSFPARGSWGTGWFNSI